MILILLRKKVEFVDSIKADVEWLGAEWNGDVLFCIRLFSTDV